MRTLRIPLRDINADQAIVGAPHCRYLGGALALQPLDGALNTPLGQEADGSCQARRRAPHLQRACAIFPVFRVCRCTSRPMNQGLSPGQNARQTRRRTLTSMRCSLLTECLHAIWVLQTCSTLFARPCRIEGTPDFGRKSSETERRMVAVGAITLQGVHD